MKGSITLFFSLIFFVIIAFLGSLFFYGRNQIVQAGIRKDADAAGYSTMAEYQKSWVEEYGLYGVKKSRVQPAFLFYMEQNAQHGWGEYQMEELEIKSWESWQDIAVLQKQIETFMSERGFLDLLAEVLEQLKEIQMTDKETKAFDEQELETLGEIQYLYAQLITDVEGIRNDGGENPYSIRTLWKKIPSEQQIRNAAQAREPSLEQISLLEKAYDEIKQVEQLCLEAAELADEIIKHMNQLQKPEQMPITSEQLQDYKKIWRKNHLICQEIGEKLYRWLTEFDSTEEVGKQEAWQALQQALQKWSDYDASIRLPYEYKEGGNSWNFKEILNRLKGYSVEVGDLAPDQELELGLVEKENSADWEELSLETGLKERFLLGEYVLGIFQNFQENIESDRGGECFDLRGNRKKDRFLQNEVEFLIEGKENEYRNVDGVRAKLMLLRTTLNMGYLLSDTSKRAEIHAAASIGGILLPGIGDSIAFGLILTIWGRAEAIQDYQALIEGKKVPLWKNDENWKTDLSSILSGTEQQESGNEQGLTYRQYLRFLIYLEKPEELLQRMQMLLALNLGEEDLQNMVTGFEVEGTVKGLGYSGTFTGDYRYDDTED